MILIMVKGYKGKSGSQRKIRVIKVETILLNSGSSKGMDLGP